MEVAGNTRALLFDRPFLFDLAQVSFELSLFQHSRKTCDGEQGQQRTGHDEPAGLPEARTD